MQTDSITATEGAVLDVIQRKGIATVPDIAVVTRMTPSEAKFIVDRLLSMRLVEQVESSRLTHVEPSFFRLTKDGQEVAHDLEKRFVSSRSRARGLMDASDIESLLDEALSKLPG